jgi:hypothetical protein
MTFAWSGQEERVQWRKISCNTVSIKIAKNICQKMIPLHFWSVCVAQNIFIVTIDCPFAKFYRKLLLVGVGGSNWLGQW